MKSVRPASNHREIPGFTKYGEKFTRPATGRAPLDIVLPRSPE